MQRCPVCRRTMRDRPKEWVSHHFLLAKEAVAEATQEAEESSTEDSPEVREKLSRLFLAVLFRC